MTEERRRQHIEAELREAQKNLSRFNQSLTTLIALGANVHLEGWTKNQPRNELGTKITQTEFYIYVA